MLFDEYMNFIEHCFWSSTFINAKINNILAYRSFFTFVSIFVIQGNITGFIEFMGILLY